MACKWDDSFIVVDSRENLPFWPEAQRCTLTSGDYSFRGGENWVSIERKSVQDLFGSLGGRGGTRRIRLAAAFDRLSYFKWKAVVIEGSISGLYEARRFGRITPAMAIGTMFSWEQKYRVPVHFCEDRAQARAITKLILRLAWKDMQRDG